MPRVPGSRAEKLTSGAVLAGDGALRGGGNLQALLDEYCHQLWEQSAWSRPPAEELAMEVARSMAEATTLKVSRVKADIYSTRGGYLHAGKFNIRTLYALRYGRILGDDDSVLAREGAVRRAFNSPFRPFVLASTSIGQEGLDFHPWCHVIYHWNLPGNPVDLEQREGRVHRYKGHAVRKNVARAFADGGAWQPGAEIWTGLFRTAGLPSGSELEPFWLCDGETAVERRVPSLSYSRELERLRRLRRDLVAYRLVFGQPRQQELLASLADRASDREVVTWTLDLAPTP